jgi:hypothetical protein
MAFRGIYEAPELTPTPCGILSVARIMSHTSAKYDERWVRGFAYEFDSYATVRLLTVDDATVTNGTIYDASTDPNYLDYTPFFIESEIAQSLFGILGEDRFKIALKQLEAATQKAVERELWEGKAAQADSNSNNYLTKSSEATIPAAGAYPASDALFHIEQALSGSPTGQNGVIHMTRDVASILGSKLVYLPGPEGKPGKVMTRLGTDVIIGSGYTGNGPTGATGATASATNRWMFATGPVDVHLSKPEVVNDSIAQGVGHSQNDSKIKAVRAAAVYFDPSCHFAMRVAVPALA